MRHTRAPKPYGGREMAICRVSSTPASPGDRQTAATWPEPAMRLASGGFGGKNLSRVANTNTHAIVRPLPLPHPSLGCRYDGSV